MKIDRGERQLGLVDVGLGDVFGVAYGDAVYIKMANPRQAFELGRSQVVELEADVKVIPYPDAKLKLEG